MRWTKQIQMTEVKTNDQEDSKRSKKSKMFRLEKVLERLDKRRVIPNINDLKQNGD